jgi:hypothetical protein
MSIHPEGKISRAGTSDFGSSGFVLNGPAARSWWVRLRLTLLAQLDRLDTLYAVHLVRPGRNRPISVYRCLRRALTLCPHLYMGIQPDARFPARSADALPATLYALHLVWSATNCSKSPSTHDKLSFLDYNATL